jgi:hypothetical protein
MPTPSDAPNFDSLNDEPAPAAPIPVAAKQGDFWRQGHKRPWWQWNVITLFVSLFVLTWFRELAGISQTATWITCVMIIGAWGITPAIIDAFQQTGGGQGVRVMAYLGSLAILVGIMAFAGIHIGIFSVLAVILMAVAVRARHD